MGVRLPRPARRLDGDRHLGPRLFEVTYEDLVSEPARVLTEISMFLELPPIGSWIQKSSSMVRPNERHRIERGHPSANV